MATSTTQKSLEENYALDYSCLEGIAKLTAYKKMEHEVFFAKFEKLFIHILDKLLPWTGKHPD